MRICNSYNKSDKEEKYSLTHFQNDSSWWTIKKTLTANQNPHDFKELASRAYKIDL